MRRLSGASLLEAIVAAVIFLTVFAAAMELMPRLAVRGDDAVLLAEARLRVDRAFQKYASGVWPCGEYTETYDWGTVRVRVAEYSDFDDIRDVEATARIANGGRLVRHRQLIRCAE